MSIRRIHSQDAKPPSERRLRARQRMDDLAYVDIGADNGGIILNLSDDGLGFQAAVPLGDQTEVDLRIQLPRSRTRVETPADIVWVSAENRQAGVRFRDIPAETLVQIQEWIRSRHSPDELPAESASKTDPFKESARSQRPTAPARKDKWIRLMAPAEEPKPHTENSPPIEQKPRVENSPSIEHKADTNHSNPIADDHPPIIPAQQTTSPGSAPRETQIPRAHSEDTSIRKDPEKVDIKLPRFVLNDPPIAEESEELEDATTILGNSDRRDPVNWSTRKPQIVPPSVHDDDWQRFLPLIESAAIPASSTSTNKNSNLPASEATEKPILPVPAKYGYAQKWAGAVMLLAGISLFCFGIGTWIGHQNKQPHVAQLPVEPAFNAPVAAPAVDAGTKISSIVRPMVNGLKIRRRDTTAGHVLESPQPRIAPAPSAPRSEPTSEAPPVAEDTTPSIAAKPAEAKPVPPPIAAETADPPPVAARIVAGRRLRPADRFNPCHLSYRLEPTYPADAKQRLIEGTVKIHQVIAADGSVQSVTLISGPPLLAPAALEAAKYWRYLPALLNGQPVETEQDVAIDFRLPR